MDRLSPNQARRLLRLVKTDPELAEAAEESSEPAGRRWLSIAGIGASGEGDLRNGSKICWRSGSIGQRERHALRHRTFGRHR